MRVLIIRLLTALTFPIVNGDEHEVQLVDPNGQNIIGKTMRRRGREYVALFEARKVGAYHLDYGSH